ncbi:MAG: xylulokinase [bacterium]
MPLFLGIDVGTTSTRVLAIDEKGEIKASVSKEYPMLTPQPGWAEQNPEDWWRATVEGIREALSKGINPEDVKGIGLSGQMHGSVFLDKNGEVIRPAILWCDQRTAEQCEWITNKIGKEKVIEYTSNPVLTGFTAPKIIWLRDIEPENFEKLAKVLLPKDYIRYRLTGEYASEVSDASGTSLFDVKNRRWSREMVEGIGLSMDILPKVYESPEITGRLSRIASEETGLPEGVPVVGGGGDQAAGGVGAGVVERGKIFVSLGTSGVVFAFTEEPVIDKGLRLHTFCHAVPGKWHVMGVMLSAGGSYRWFRDALGEPERAMARLLRIDEYELINKEAEMAPPGCEGLIFLPYLTGERTPHADPYARGVFFGLTYRCTKGFLARAVMEGVSFGLRDSYEILKEMNIPIEEVRMIGGGARSRLWRQITASIFNMPNYTLNMEEGPSFGVALLASVGVGFYSSVEEACKATIYLKEKTEPKKEEVEIYQKLYPLYRSLYISLKEHFRQLASIV